MIINPDEIKQKLLKTQGQQGRYYPPIPGLAGEEKHPAAVLIPLLQDQGTWKILFIKRTQAENDRHSGQIAFPGGRADPSDTTLMNTALREAEEEIGLNPRDLEILGQSSSITTVTNYEVTPFVSVLPWPYPLNLSQIEVEKILLIPIEWLADPHNHRTNSWKPEPAAKMKFPVIFFNDYQGEILWGATAQIVIDFLELIEIIP